METPLKISKTPNTSRYLVGMELLSERDGNFSNSPSKISCRISVGRELLSERDGNDTAPYLLFRRYGAWSEGNFSLKEMETSTSSAVILETGIKLSEGNFSPKEMETTTTSCFVKFTNIIPVGRGLLSERDGNNKSLSN
ncbi:hypothetical protein A4H02_04410 [Fervidobacterium thailandense]|uniref:Uncharacterized protein n=2 Tax=Fervidobacterium thailandense TaxID=1008305 RepID=A0A1E3G3D0_9BACT|nr:hypothetical protein A4H02_04410 [Fervidobacterium thailandense]